MRSTVKFRFLCSAFLGLMCFITACTEAPEPVQETSVVAPSITYQDILNNPEFRHGIQQALLNNDSAAFSELQDKAVEIGRAAGLPENEMALLEGQRGEDFISFQAKRQLFNIEFERAYQNLEPVEPIKKRYPEAKDLFVKVDALVFARDESIRAIAEEMANGEDASAFLQLAQEQWRAKASVSSK